ncbi:MAG: hypothetical protein DMF62_04850 [Acidobacteria bacterium]|nr:MAG: hypothetical protein DMF62_04850 [Acidobacteriota bacterium]
MGAIKNAIEAILANNNLTDAEKKVEIRRIRGEALRDNIPNLPFTINLVGNNSITIETADWDPVRNVLTLNLSAIRAGQPLPLDNPFVYVNPPTHIEDPAGTDLVQEMRDRQGNLIATKRYREAPLLALRAIVIDSVRNS